MSKSPIQQKFSEFHSKWMDQNDEFFQASVTAYQNRSPKDYPAMIEKLSAHQKEYYNFKWAVAHEDALSFFMPVWLNPLECAYQWMTGWKPSLAFRLAKMVSGLTQEQLQRLETFKARIKAEEDKVEREMERLQVGMAGREVVEAMRNGGGNAAEAMAGLEKVMKRADCARLNTMKGVLEVLNPVQGVVFMSSLSLVLGRVKKLGGKPKQGSVILHP